MGDINGIMTQEPDSFAYTVHPGILCILENSDFFHLIYQISVSWISTTEISLTTFFSQVLVDIETKAFVFLRNKLHAFPSYFRHVCAHVWTEVSFSVLNILYKQESEFLLLDLSPIRNPQNKMYSLQKCQCCFLRLIHKVEI